MYLAMVEHPVQGALFSQSVKRGSPAQRSQILVGDVVVAVNGTKLAGLPLNIVRKIMDSSGDQMVLTVLSSSPWRIINTRWVTKERSPSEAIPRATFSGEYTYGHYGQRFRIRGSAATLRFLSRDSKC
ncbi:hypothetical protein HPB48_006086 [Haemaphysalis longicornis]|uniref:PDZ domain-containing protein n=1 Tax=Haemaphysalis longicornis TaxID=44386 RepID=A0A9J6GT82_HAELO|nr:hypothetical protein HPB48_006086 [Haemaphysalis longicornis]